MIEYRKGNIFDSGADYIVCPVNCVGTMGAGLAKQFADRYPSLQDVYKESLRYGQLTTREVGWIFPEIFGVGIILLATKWHWKEPSELLFIRWGLSSLRDKLEFWYDKDEISVAIPRIGAGLGGLPWEAVKMEIESFERDCPPNVKVIVYE